MRFSHGTALEMKFMSVGLLFWQPSTTQNYYTPAASPLGFAYSLNSDAYGTNVRNDKNCG